MDRKHPVTNVRPTKTVVVPPLSVQTGSTPITPIAVHVTPVVTPLSARMVHPIGICWPNAKTVMRKLDGNTWSDCIVRLTYIDDALVIVFECTHVSRSYRSSFVWFHGLHWKWASNGACTPPIDTATGRVQTWSFETPMNAFAELMGRAQDRTIEWTEFDTKQKCLLGNVYYSTTDHPEYEQQKWSWPCHLQFGNRLVIPLARFQDSTRDEFRAWQWRINVTDPVFLQSIIAHLAIVDPFFHLHCHVDATSSSTRPQTAVAGNNTTSTASTTVSNGSFKPTAHDVKTQKKAMTTPATLPNRAKLTKSLNSVASGDRSWLLLQSVAPRAEMQYALPLFKRSAVRPATATTSKTNPQVEAFTLDPISTSPTSRTTTATTTATTITPGTTARAPPSIDAGSLKPGWMFERFRPECQEWMSPDTWIRHEFSHSDIDAIIKSCVNPQPIWQRLLAEGAHLNLSSTKITTASEVEYSGKVAAQSQLADLCKRRLPEGKDRQSVTQTRWHQSEPLCRQHHPALPIHPLITIRFQPIVDALRDRQLRTTLDADLCGRYPSAKTAIYAATHEGLEYHTKCFEWRNILIVPRECNAAGTLILMRRVIPLVSSEPQSIQLLQSYPSVIAIQTALTGAHSGERKDSLLHTRSKTVNAAKRASVAMSSESAAVTRPLVSKGVKSMTTATKEVTVNREVRWCLYVMTNEAFFFSQGVASRAPLPLTTSTTSSKRRRIE